MRPGYCVGWVVLSLSSLIFFFSPWYSPNDKLSIRSGSLSNKLPWLRFSFYYSLELFLSSQENNRNTPLVLLCTKRAESANCYRKPETPSSEESVWNFSLTRFSEALSTNSQTLRQCVCRGIGRTFHPG